MTNSDKGDDSAGANGSNGAAGRKVPGREPLMKPLPRRFYKAATCGPDDEGFAVLLDGRAARTPGKRKLAVASRALAEALAEEWDAQGTSINPATMPLSRIVIAALDGVAGNERAVAEDIVAFAGSDLICYRAASPPGLVELQAMHWNPVIAWAASRLGAHFKVAEGIVHVAQDADALDRLRAQLDGRDAIQLAALHVMTTLTGSALIALAHADKVLGVEAAWQAAHVDEDWQIRQWGEDEEAAERRERRWRDMQAASRILALA
ncbi:MAG: ATPase [Hyphomicrobiaceae bacterium]|nr:ATPase [Hyphomicrobiaceae bacterium]